MKDRRERLATSCLSGFIAHPEFGHYEEGRIARMALAQADALITELDKERT